MLNKIKYISLIIILFTASVSTKVDAMSVYFEKDVQDVKVGDTFIINTYIDSENTEINGVDGVIKIDGNVDLLNMSVAGSVFDLWPNKPSLKNQEISFVGGSPSNVFGKKNKIFSFAVKARDIGKVNISLKQADVFLGDGKGTKLASMGKSMLFDIGKSNNVVKNELSELILNDKTLPKDFKIELGRDYSMYDGKYFISFYTTDNESGINRYEVRENNLPAIRSTNSYVLEDQSLKGFVEVKAIDNAGNIRIELLDLSKISVSENNKYKYIYTIVIAVIILIIFLLIYKHFGFKIKINKK